MTKPTHPNILSVKYSIKHHPNMEGSDSDQEMFVGIESFVIKDIENGDPNNLLHWACKYGNWKAFEKIIKINPKCINQENSQGQKPLDLLYDCSYEEDIESIGTEDLHGKIKTGKEKIEAWCINYSYTLPQRPSDKLSSSNAGGERTALVVDKDEKVINDIISSFPSAGDAQKKTFAHQVSAILATGKKINSFDQMRQLDGGKWWECVKRYTTEKMLASSCGVDALEEVLSKGLGVGSKIGTMDGTFKKMSEIAKKITTLDLYNKPFPSGGSDEAKIEYWARENLDIAYNKLTQQSQKSTARWRYKDLNSHKYTIIPIVKAIQPELKECISQIQVKAKGLPKPSAYIGLGIKLEIVNGTCIVGEDVVIRSIDGKDIKINKGEVINSLDGRAVNAQNIITLRDQFSLQKPVAITINGNKSHEILPMLINHDLTSDKLVRRERLFPDVEIQHLPKINQKTR